MRSISLVVAVTAMPLIASIAGITGCSSSARVLSTRDGGNDGGTSMADGGTSMTDGGPADAGAGPTDAGSDGGPPACLALGAASLTGDSPFGALDMQVRSFGAADCLSHARASVTLRSAG